MGLEKISILSIALSTVAFFVARFYADRYLENQQIPKGTTRSLVVFSLALAVSYAVGLAVEWAGA
jgi:hypothetical protein